jgi:hypothetical protein
MSGYRDACSLEHERDGYLLNRSAKGEAPNRCQLIFGLPGIQTVLSYDLDEPSGFCDTRTDMAEKDIERLAADESLGETIDTLVAAAKSRSSARALAGVCRSTVFGGNHFLREGHSCRERNVRTPFLRVPPGTPR